MIATRTAVMAVLAMLLVAATASAHSLRVQDDDGFVMAEIMGQSHMHAHVPCMHVRTVARCVVVRVPIDGAVSVGSSCDVSERSGPMEIIITPMQREATNCDCDCSSMR